MTGLPSIADLDAHAAEESIREATQDASGSEAWCASVAKTGHECQRPLAHQGWHRHWFAIGTGNKGSMDWEDVGAEGFEDYAQAECLTGMERTKARHAWIASRKRGSHA